MDSNSLAVVTGGSRGLGYVVAKSLKAAGNRVLIVSKDPERAAKSAAEINCEYETVDFEDLVATQSKFEEIREKYGTPSILVLAHGVMSEKMSKTLLNYLKCLKPS
jgi:NAD(P)-dependent dehydrogenase (short-subunit alcohol dehydrogenase family)